MHTKLILTVFRVILVYVLCHCVNNIIVLTAFLITHVNGIGALIALLALSVCLSVYPQHNSKTNDPIVFKLDIGNDLGIS